MITGAECVYPTMPLGYAADVRPSGVDKKSADGETPVRLCNYTDVYYHDHITASMTFMEATANATEIERLTLHAGDVVMTKDSETADDIGIPAIVTEDLGGVILGYHNTLLRPVPEVVEPRFLFYALNSKPTAGYFETKARGVTRVGLRTEDVASVPVPVPPLEVQRRVADMLDAETARIDTLIAKNDQVLGLLAVRWQSLLEARLFDGVASPRSPLWLHCEITPGYAFASSHFRHRQGDVRLLRGVNVGVGNIDWTEAVYADQAVANEAADYRLRAGDLVLGMDRPWISTGLRVATICHDDEPAYLVQRVARLRPDPNLHPQYLYQVLQSRRFYAAFEPSMTGVSVPHVSATQIGDFKVPMPPVEEQEQVLDELTVEHERTERLRSAVVNQQDLLRTRWRALITATVAGQIEV